MRTALAILALAASLAWSHRALAHETRSGEIVIDVVTDVEARVTLRGAEIEAPLGCSFSPPVLRCAGGVAGRTVQTRGAGVVFVSFGDGASTVVTARAPAFELPGRAPRHAHALRFFALGVEHVLSGLDHVLLLLALFWQAWTGRARTTARALLGTATAFTIGHSLTLALTLLSVLRVPPLVAEACIAWSLVLAALDGPRADRARVPLAAAFGLVHGLGFAGALSGTALPASARWTALAAFNLGIEAGQGLLFVAFLALARLVPRVPRLPAACTWVVGATGATMFFLRAAALFR